MTLQKMLSKNERTATTIARTILYLCATLLFIQFILSLILPTLTFSHNVRNTDPVFDLSTPIPFPARTEDENQDTPRTVFSASTERSGDTITLTITTHNANIEGRRVDIYKTYQSWHTNALREVQEPIDQIQPTNSNPFRAGTIVRSETEYFIVDGQMLRPIDRPETLLASGYSFDNVTVSTSQERSLYSKGKIFTMRDTHPDGTIFSATSTDLPELYEKAGRDLTRKSQEEVSRKKAPDQTIEVSLNDRTTSRSCVLRKKSFARSGMYSCEVDVRDLTHHFGKDYIFVIEDTQSSELASITARITQSPTKQNIQRQIGLILSKIKPQ